MENENKKIKLIFWIINIVVLAAIICWFRENISVTDVVNELLKMPKEGILGALIVNLVVMAVYGDRLSILLGTRRLPALGIVIIGFGMNGILPYRLGELSKFAYANKIYSITTSRLLAATILEKLMDLCALLILSIVVSRFIVAPYLDLGIFATTILVGMLILAILIAIFLLTRWERSGRKIHSWIAVAFETLRVQNQMVRICRLAFQTVAIWSLIIISIFWMFSSIFSNFSIIDAAVLTVVLALAIAVPGAPAGLGLVEAAFVAYLHQSLLIEASKALSSALAFRLAVVAPQIFLTAVILLGSMFRRN